MKWLPGRGWQAKEPQQQPASRDEQMRDAFSPWTAGLTDDKGMSWKQFLREEFGTEPDEAGMASEPPVSVPAPRAPAEGHRLGELNLVFVPFPGSGYYADEPDHDAEAG